MVREGFCFKINATETFVGVPGPYIVTVTIVSTFVCLACFIVAGPCTVSEVRALTFVSPARWLTGRVLAAPSTSDLGGVRVGTKCLVLHITREDACFSWGLPTWRGAGAWC